MGSRPITSSPVRNRAYRDRNQRTFIVEYEPQRSLGRGSDFAADLSQHFGAFSPLPFNSPVDAQRIWHPHLTNLADGKIHKGITLLDEVAETWKVPGYGYSTLSPDLSTQSLVKTFP
jgi:hypothetical protein